jgi:hypothetical protein
MTFAIGFIVGLVLGSATGAAMMGIALAGRLSDLQERLDAWETTRWRP